MMEIRLCIIYLVKKKLFVLLHNEMYVYVQEKYMFRVFVRFVDYLLMHYIIFLNMYEVTIELETDCFYSYVSMSITPLIIYSTDLELELYHSTK